MSIKHVSDLLTQAVGGAARLNDDIYRSMHGKLRVAIQHRPRMATTEFLAKMAFAGRGLSRNGRHNAAIALLSISSFGL